VLADLFSVSVVSRFRRNLRNASFALIISCSGCSS
jgi:hypothetical protein